MRRLWLARLALGALLAGALAACGGGAGTVTAAPSATPAFAAGAIEHVAVSSAALERSMPAAVYLPPGYLPQSRYPVLYLFYGYGGNVDSYFDAWLAINRTADRLIAAQAIEPLIIVVPDYANSFGVNTTVAQAANSAGGSIGPYEDYLIKELMPFIDSRYSTDARRERRYVGGISMGGFAALHLGLRHTAMFSKVGGHSAALWNYSGFDQFFGQRDWLYATPELRAQRDPLLLAATADLNGVRFYLDVGNGDRLYTEVDAMYQALQARGADVQMRSASGGHDGAYWGSQLENYLLFYSRKE
jgi:enterochelin esterase-like enzyme